MSSHLIVSLARSKDFSLAECGTPILLGSPRIPGSSRVILVPSIPTRVMNSSSVTGLLGSDVRISVPASFANSFIIRGSNSVDGLRAGASSSSVSDSLMTLIDHSH